MTNEDKKPVSGNQNKRNLYFYIPYITLVLIAILFILVYMLSVEKYEATRVNSAAVSSAHVDKKMVNDAVKTYIKENPQVILSSIQEFRKKEAENEQEHLVKFVSTNYHKMIYETDPKVGADDAKVKIIEFFDYNCSYCHKAHDAINKALANNKDVQVIYKDLPIFGEKSILLARASITFNKMDKEKFQLMHSKLFTLADESLEGLKALATENGFDAMEFENIFKSTEVGAAIGQNYQLSQSLRIQGTPFFIINGKIYGGFIPENDLLNIIDKEIEVVNESIKNSEFIKEGNSAQENS